MRSYSYWKRLYSFANMRQTRIRDGIYSSEEFRVIIERERTRADRDGICFSLVVFDTVNSESNGAYSGYIVQSLLEQRIRATDEVGWFEKQHIAVLLYNTKSEGAWCFSDKVRKIIATKASPPRCRVYSYPFDWRSNGDGTKMFENFNSEDVSSNRYSTTSHNQALFFEQAPGKQLSSTSRSAATTINEHTRSMMELITLFFRGIPGWKRVLDIVASASGLFVLSPLLLFVFIIIKIVSPGPVFFKQRRVGYMGKTFNMWKFRTMKVNADVEAHRQHVTKLINGSTGNAECSKEPMTKLDNDPQIILFGNILRKTCIDELPQLINVLRGEMSLVGPRPPIPYEVDEYLRWHNGRFDAVPGITGMWQVSGKNRLTFEQMIRLDIQYLRQLSFWLDVKIILMTPFAIISQANDSLLKRKFKVKGVGENV